MEGQIHTQNTVHPKISANYQHMSACICGVKNANPFIIYIHFYFTFVNHVTLEESAAHTLNCLF